ncbi:MAG TPA: DUF5693 family protein, partial [Deinococcales bacterium]|nr:DUF5693 family protein [Deinococcales bacterium]
MRKYRTLLLALLAVSFIPALLLAYHRITFERDYKTYAIVMDYQAAHATALANGLTDEAYLGQVKALGVNGVAIYEDTLARAIQRDDVIYRAGSDWRNELRLAGKPFTAIDPAAYYIRSVKPGAAETFAAMYNYPHRTETIDGQSWIAFPIDPKGLVYGPDLNLIARLRALGLLIVYRPLNVLQMRDPGANFPKVDYLVYGGDEVTGYGDPDKLEKVRQRTANTITGLVEATDQKGMEVISKTNPMVRVFSVRPEWQAVLQPEEVASKFVLAARERNHRLLYVRPFQRPNDTVIFLNKTKAGLDKAGLVEGKPGPLDYQPNRTLRLLSAVGPVIATLLLVTVFPWEALGWAVAAACLLLAVAFGGRGFGAPALLAGCVFPVLGLGLWRNTPFDWLKATLLTVVGAVFLGVLGAGRLEVLAIAPFRGVAATLILPPLLLAVALLPRQDWRKTFSDLWNTPITLGTLGLGLLGLAAVALVYLRRGNTPAVGVSDIEAKARAALQDTLIRPRTKELLLHPAAILGLTGVMPAWITNVLLVAGVVGQGSIIDTFAHYHTPLLISLLRTFNGIWAGALIGAVVA